MGDSLADKMAWAFGAFLVLLVFPLLFKMIMRLRRARRQLAVIHAERLQLARICAHCGYDLRAAQKPGASGICPECGSYPGSTSPQRKSN